MRAGLDVGCIRVRPQLAQRVVLFLVYYEHVSFPILYRAVCHAICAFLIASSIAILVFAFPLIARPMIFPEGIHLMLLYGCGGWLIMFVMFLLRVWYYEHLSPVYH